jgi:hypothetical protein
VSVYSHEHHVYAPQQAALALLETSFRAQGCHSFDVVSLPQKQEARNAFITENERESPRDVSEG